MTMALVLSHCQRVCIPVAYLNAPCPCHHASVAKSHLQGFRNLGVSECLKALRVTPIIFLIPTFAWGLYMEVRRLPPT